MKSLYQETFPASAAAAVRRQEMSSKILLRGKLWEAITTSQEVLYFGEQLEKDKFVRRVGILAIAIYLVEALIRQLWWQDSIHGTQASGADVIHLSAETNTWWSYCSPLLSLRGRKMAEGNSVIIILHIILKSTSNAFYWLWRGNKWDWLLTHNFTIFHEQNKAASIVFEDIIHNNHTIAYSSQFSHGKAILMVSKCPRLGPFISDEIPLLRVQQVDDGSSICPRAPHWRGIYAWLVFPQNLAKQSILQTTSWPEKRQLPWALSPPTNSTHWAKSPTGHVVFKTTRLFPVGQNSITHNSC